MPQKSAYQTWCTGEVNTEVVDFWNTLKSMNNIKLSSLIPFLRISYVKYKPNSNGDIKEILPYKNFKFITSQLQSENRKGYYGIENFDLEVTGTANSLYKGNMSLKVYDLDLIESRKGDIYKLLNLGSNVMLEFGWSKWDWQQKNYNSINKLIHHGGKGHTLFAKVSGREISFTDENIMEIQLQFTSTTYNVMNNQKLQNLVQIEWDDLSDDTIEILNITTGKYQWFRNWLAKLSSKESIKLKHLFKYLNRKIKEEKDISMITGYFDLKIPVDRNAIKPGDSANPNIILDGDTVGDFLVTVELIKKLYDKSKTYRKFINNILTKINKAYPGDINLELIKTPKGNESIIEDKAQDASLLWKNRDKYFKLEYGTKNALVEDISFSSDLNDAMKNQEILSNTAQIKGATPTKLKTFVTTWIHGEEKWESKSEDERKAIINNLSKKEPDELMNTLLEESSLYKKGEDEDQKEFISSLKTIIRNKQIRDNSIRYMPYKMSVTILGLSDIWTGANLYLDKNFINPIHKNTIWKVTDVKHELSDNDWKVSFDAQLVYRKKWHKFANKIHKFVQDKIANNTGIEKSGWQYYQ